MTIDLSGRTDQQIENLIANHEKKGALAAPLYVAAIRERVRRRGFDVERSKEIIMRAARERRFLSYLDFATAYGQDFNRVRWPLIDHLGDVVIALHSQGFPMVSAIVVNKEHTETGQMNPATLKGFVDLARRLGYTVIDGEAFLREQQEEVFARFAGN